MNRWWTVPASRWKSLKPSTQDVVNHLGDRGTRGIHSFELRDPRYGAHIDAPKRVSEARKAGFDIEIRVESLNGHAGRRYILHPDAALVASAAAGDPDLDAGTTGGKERSRHDGAVERVAAAASGTDAAAVDRLGAVEGPDGQPIYPVPPHSFTKAPIALGRKYQKTYQLDPTQPNFGVGWWEARDESAPLLGDVDDVTEVALPQEQTQLEKAA